MAIVAACTDKGAKRSVNQDACCVQVAQTPYGEVVMAIVCDGVGGLSAGELASATVTFRFAQWFRQELPTLMSGMAASQPFDFRSVEMVWKLLLSNLNEMIHAYGKANSVLLGTTFTGLLLCGGKYLVGHVGDCRVYQLESRGVRQVTEDQTLLAKKLAQGEITLEEAKTFGQKHVILQSVGTEGILKPAFYSGTYTPNDLFVLCCDGAYRKVEDRGVHSFFEGVNRADEGALQEACRNLLAYDIEHGEKDNLTILCVYADLEKATQQMPTSQVAYQPVSTTDASMGVSMSEFASLTDDDEDDDLVTMVQDEDDVPVEEDLPTEVESQNEPEEDYEPTVVEMHTSNDEDSPTEVEPQDALNEDNLPTEVETTVAMSEDDLPTEVESGTDIDEEDLPTLVEGDES